MHFIEKIRYNLLKASTWIFQFFPFRVGYIISDIYFLLGYYIIRYRRGVVSANLANSFPYKTQKERASIARKYYRHLCDTFIETLYFDRMSARNAKNCVRYLNPELPNGYLSQGRQVIGFLGHYNNWEWLCNWPLHSPHRFYPVYKKLKSYPFERFYFNLRSRFGANPLERSLTFRQLVSDHNHGTPSLSAFLFDQTPRVYEIHHWVNFLNQDTPVILGAEKVARKLDGVVLFAHTKKIKRGYYEVEYKLVTDQAKQCPEFEITEKCTRLLENQINENPEFWLWSHKRWKHTRASVAAYNSNK